MSKTLEAIEAELKEANKALRAASRAHVKALAAAVVYILEACKSGAVLRCIADEEEGMIKAELSNGNDFNNCASVPAEAAEYIIDYEMLRKNLSKEYDYYAWNSSGPLRTGGRSLGFLAEMRAEAAGDDEAEADEK